MEELEEAGEAKALLIVWLKALLSLSYAYFIASKLPKGKLRLFSLLPIFSLFTLLPLSLSTPTTAGLTGFFLTWLANFKLLLFSFDLGPLSDDYSRKSLLTFILVAAFPIKINQKKKHLAESSRRQDLFEPKLEKRLSKKYSPGQISKVDQYSESKLVERSFEKHPFGQNSKVDQKLPLNLWSKALIYCLLVIAAFLIDYNKNVHPNVLLGIYCCVVYLNLEVILGICNKMVGSILGVELSPPFDEPYLSTSLQDFWGRRWNLMVSDALRYTIYLPTKTFCDVRIGRRWASLPAVMTAFVVSGLMHELLFYYITRVSPTWEVTCFFVLHGACLVVEIGLRRGLGLGGNWALHWAVAGPLTVGFVMVTGFWLFFPQLLRNNVDARSLEEIKAVGRFVKGILGIDTN